VRWQLVAPELAEQTPPPTHAHDTVVVEHRHAIARQPHVALQARGAEAQAEGKRLQRVLSGVGAGAAMSERDRSLEERGEPLLHAGR
jgi:hypothetical protein